MPAMPRALRLLFSLSLFAILAVIVLWPTEVLAERHGGDPKPPCIPVCPTCDDPDCIPLSASMADSRVSLTEGNFTETYEGPRVKSAIGTTLRFDLTYNSYDADGSRASVDTVMGYGWTHTYNDFLFTQRGDMFRMGPDGRITRFALGPNGTYVTTPGYFETLVNNLDGSFTITTKHQTKYRYESIPETAFLVDGPVLRLTSITKPNNDVTTLTYAGGNLQQVCNLYGVCLSFTYNANHHLISATDPLGNKTDFTYNANGCLLMTATDPTLKTTDFTYNPLFQMTSHTDRDGRKFTIQYRNGLPYAELDGNGARVFALSNTSNWAIDHTQLAAIMMRVYIPSTTTKTDGRGNNWTYTYDSNGYVSQAVAPDGATTTYTYDPATLEVATETDANFHTTSYAYDSQGNAIQRKDANGNITAYSFDPVFNHLTSMTDPQGRVTSYTLDSQGNRAGETDPLLGTRSWTYDSHGNILTTTDKDGNTTSFIYDSHGNLMQSTDALGETTQYAYDSVGDLLSVTDANNHTTSRQYDALYRLTTQTDALGGIKQYFYDGEGDRIQFIDENNHPTTSVFDLRRRMTRVTDALGKSDIYAYDANNNRLSGTDRNGHTTTSAFDLQNRPTKTTDALGHVSSITYDGVGNKLSDTDANGHTTFYGYDALNRRFQSKDALNEVTQWGYDLTGLPGHPECTGPTLGSGMMTQQTDANGKVIYYCYDGLDRLHIEIHKQGSTAYTITGNDAVTYTTYDANSNRLTLTEPDGNTTNYSYDALNRVVTMVNAAGDTTMTAYDPVGNVHSTTAPNLNVTTNTYDALNRLVQRTDSQALVQTTAYDPVGNITSQRDGNNNGPSYAYDGVNRITSMTDSLGKPTSYVYDNVGNLLNVTDRNNHLTSYTYDAINRRITLTDAQPATTRFQYDNVGNLLKLTDANGHATSYTYDALNRRLSETYPDLTHNTVSYTYDAVGNRISRTDQKGQITTYAYSDLYFLLQRTYPVSLPDVFTYDLSGRVLSGNRGSWTETFLYDGANRIVKCVQNGRTISYVYNVPARVRTVTYPSGRSIAEQMDFRSWISTVNDGGLTPISQYAYDAGERVLARNYRNGTSEKVTYNTNNWVVSLTHTIGASEIVGFNYAYDSEGNKAYEQKLHDTAHSEGYSYDSVYRLISYQVGTLVGSTITMVTTQTAYNLDPLGNWNSKITDLVTQTRTHSPSNEITKINNTSILSDFNGNTSDDAAQLYFYDEENRLVQVQARSSHAILGQYQYDAFGRRVVKTDNFGVQTLFYYDGWRTVEEQSSTGVTQATYVFGNYLDEALTMDRGGQTFYYHQNALWSTYALSNSSGIPVEGYSYDSYGYQTVHLPGPDGTLWTADDVILLGAKSAYGNPFLFTEQRYDAESGLMLYKIRHYNQSFGRFVSRDPVGYLGNRGNLYEYARNRPTMFADPLGLIVGCVDYGVAFVWGVGAGAQVSRCTDDCGNVAWLISVSVRAGVDAGGGVAGGLYSGCLKNYIKGNQIDLNLSVGVVSVGSNNGIGGAGSGGHVAVSGPIPGVPPLRAGFSAGYNATALVIDSWSDLSHPCPCPPPWTKNRPCGCDCCCGDGTTSGCVHVGHADNREGCHLMCLRAGYGTMIPATSSEPAHVYLEDNCEYKH
jgi:RHS repeat-associated protein